MDLLGIQKSLLGAVEQLQNAAQRRDSCEAAVLIMSALQVLKRTRRSPVVGELPTMQASLARAEDALQRSSAGDAMEVLAGTYAEVVLCRSLGHAQGESMRHIRIDLAEILVLCCCSVAGFRDRSAFDAALERAFQRPLSPTEDAQLHKAFGDLMGNIPDCFQSKGKVTGKQRSSRRKRENSPIEVPECEIPTQLVFSQPMPEIKLMKGLSSSVSTPLQIQALLQKLTEAQLLPAEAQDLMEALEARLNELDWNYDNDDMHEAARAHLGEVAISAIVNVMIRFPSGYRVQEYALHALKRLVSYMNYVVGYRPVVTDALQFLPIGPNIAARIEKHISGTILADEWYTDLHEIARRVLTRTVPLQKFAWLDDADALGQLLDELEESLDWWIQPAISHNDTTGRKATACAFLKFLREESAIKGPDGRSDPLNTEWWVTKWGAREHGMRPRFVLVGIFFDLNQEILLPLMSMRDEKEFIIAHKALSDLTRLQLIEAPARQQVLDYLLGQSSSPFASQPPPSLRVERVHLLGANLKGAIACHQPRADDAVREVFELFNAWYYEIGASMSVPIEDESLEWLHVGFWALLEIFDGASFGRYQHKVQWYAADATGRIPPQSNAFLAAGACLQKVGAIQTQ